MIKVFRSHSDLEVVVAGEGNEEVEKETLAVFIDFWSVVVQTWTIKDTFSKTTTGLRLLHNTTCITDRQIEILLFLLVCIDVDIYLHLSCCKYKFKSKELIIIKVNLRI